MTTLSMTTLTGKNDNQHLLALVSQLAVPPEPGDVLCIWPGSDLDLPSLYLETICDDHHCLSFLCTRDADLAIMIADRIVICVPGTTSVLGEIFIPRHKIRQRQSPQYRQIKQQLAHYDAPAISGHLSITRSIAA